MYELFYIIPTKFTEEEVGGINDRVASILGKSGAVAAKTTSLGKQKLAYPVRKFKFGHEFLVDFEAEGSALPVLHNELRLEDNLIRFAIVHKATKAKSLKAEERKSKEKATVAPRQAPKIQMPVLTEEQLEKRIEEVLEEPAV